MKFLFYFMLSIFFFFNVDILSKHFLSSKSRFNAFSDGSNESHLMDGECYWFECIKMSVMMRLGGSPVFVLYVGIT